MGAIGGPLHSSGTDTNLHVTLGKESAETSKPKDPALVRKEIQQILASGDTFEIKCKNLMKVLEPPPSELSELRKFCQDNKAKLDTLKANGGWKSLRNDPEAAKSMEQFRSQAVDHVIKLSIAAVKAMGYDPPGSHSATGTPGWKSDIDTVYFPPEGMPEEVKCAEKLIFDMVFFQEFGSLSGEMFDTESYVKQPGIALDTEKGMESASGKAGFGRLELNGASLQMMRQCGGPDCPKWEKFKEEQIKSAEGNKELQRSLSESFTDAEEMEKNMRDGINKEIIERSGKEVPSRPEEREKSAADILKENPGEKKLATISFKTKALMNVGKEMDDCKAKIASLDKQLSQSSQSSGLQYIFNSLTGKDSKSLQMQGEQAQLRLGTLALIRESFFDEGYITQGAFIKVCFRAEGQMHQRKVEVFQEKLRRSREDFALTTEYQLSEAQKMKSNPQQNASSALENIAMYKGHFEHNRHGEKDEDYTDAVVETSKYSERALGASLTMLHEMEIANPKLKINVESEGEIAKSKLSKEEVVAIKEFQTLKKEVQENYFIAAELEKVKRGSVLGFKTTLTNLLLFLTDQDKIDPQKIMLPEDVIKKKKLIEESIVNKVLSKPEFKFEESLLPEDRYLALITAMAIEGHVKIVTEEKTRTFTDENGNQQIETYEAVKLDENGRVMTDQHDVELILKARCGLDPDDQEIRTYHDSARATTLSTCDLKNTDSVVKFNAKAEDLTMRAYKMAVKQKYIQCPTPGENKNLSVQSVWQQVSPQDDL